MEDFKLSKRTLILGLLGLLLFVAAIFSARADEPGEELEPDEIIEEEPTPARRVSEPEPEPEPLADEIKTGLEFNDPE
jgi:hypothetical protein